MSTNMAYKHDGTATSIVQAILVAVVDDIAFQSLIGVGEYDNKSIGKLATEREREDMLLAV